MKTFLYPLLLLLPLLFTSLPAEATHLRGGYIHYTLDAENPRKAYYTLKLYTKESSPADDPSVMIQMGDGVPLTVKRANFKTIKPDVLLSTYTWEYTFAAAGTFTATWIGENRNGGILNLAPPTDQLSMGIATETNYHPLDLNRNSVQIKTEPHFTAYRGNPLRFNLLAYDPDGDSLGYELIAPLHTDAQKLLYSSPGFTIPEGFTINRFGEVHWENPDKVGEYAFAVAITQYRKGRKVGRTIFDMQFLVLDDKLEFPEIKIENREELTFLKDSRLLVKPGEKVSLRLHFPYQADKTWLSELQGLGLKDVSFRSISSLVSEFSFTAPETLSRRQPYGINFNFAFRNPGTPYLPQIYVATLPVSLLIWQPEEVKLGMLATGNLKYTPEGHISSIPGQDIKVMLFAYNGLGNTVDLNIDSNLKAGAGRFSFVTRDSADSVVGELVFNPSQAQVSSKPYTITISSTSMQLRTSNSSSSTTQELVLQVLVSEPLPLSSEHDLASGKKLPYPNPATERFMVEAPELPDLYLQLQDVTGKKVAGYTLQPGHNLLSRPTALSPGLYFYTLSSRAQPIRSGKLVMQ
ncbi:T9SS type A sorting domain-containing protein [Pontibacter sp. BT731]|uniref:T9SS type A sorting domain-containing protein n=1 Tax=Pontibacter coccineus TaxID=3063328 RepID=UPI0026E1C79C|nr:T9SS type A sorting domain-containing protein [Pontibacter sp. BT731]MDO6389646.1 T9SS type A sorting domain-containing protein [Pontibacter sp. BT731]